MKKRARIVIACGLLALAYQAAGKITDDNGEVSLHYSFVLAFCVYAIWQQWLKRNNDDDSWL